MGVGWANGKYGPNGVEEGSQCYFFWVMVK
jgi:hypothetical protein